MDGLDITLAEPPGRLAGYGTNQPRRQLRSRIHRSGRLIAFLLVVGRPALLTGNHFVIASLLIAGVRQHKLS